MARSGAVASMTRVNVLFSVCRARSVTVMVTVCSPSSKPAVGRTKLNTSSSPMCSVTSVQTPNSIAYASEWMPWSSQTAPRTVTSQPGPTTKKSPASGSMSSRVGIITSNTCSTDRTAVLPTPSVTLTSRMTLPTRPSTGRTSVWVAPPRSHSSMASQGPSSQRASTLETARLSVALTWTSMVGSSPERTVPAEGSIILTTGSSASRKMVGNNMFTTPTSLVARRMRFWSPDGRWDTLTSASKVPFTGS